MATFLPTSYSNLKSMIQEMSEDDSQEFIDYIPTAIYLAEERLFRLVDENFFKTDSTSYNVIAGSTTLTKPADHRVTKNVYIVVSGEYRRLIFKSQSFIRDYWPTLSATAEPKYYGNQNPETWAIAPSSDATYPIVVEYEAQPTTLSTSNETNVYITKYPDLLFYAAMSEACDWMRETGFKAEWESKLLQAVNTASMEGVRNRQDDNSHVYNPETGLNTKS